jgi:hemolysin III
MIEPRKYLKSEETANAISHLAGALLATAALVLMIVFSALRGNAWHIVSTSIYGVTLVLLYFSSGMAHALKQGKAKEVFFIFDKIAIFLLIAGTYTPLSLVMLQGALGWVLFGLEWGMALAGIIMTFTRIGKSEERVNYIFVALYVAMGWLMIIAIVPIFNSLPLSGFFWLLSGGLFYSFGILFYAKAKFLYHHLVWHLLVIAGSLSHFIVIFNYVIPSK